MIANETKEQNAVKGAMVPLIVSNDGASHKDAAKRWNHFAADIKVDGVRMAQIVVRYKWRLLGSSSKEAWSPRL